MSNQSGKPIFLLKLVISSLFLVACCPINQDCGPRTKQGWTGIGTGEIKSVLWIGHGWVDTNESVKIKYSIINNSSAPLKLTRTDGPVLDIVVTLPNYTKEYWSATNDANAIYELILEPYEQRDFEWAFVPSTDGIYYVDGIFWFGRISSSVPETLLVGVVGE